MGLSGKGGYICRITKGELQLNGYRVAMGNYTNITAAPQLGPIKKRGRKTIINLMRSYRWIKTHQQRSMLLYGLERP